MVGVEISKCDASAFILSQDFFGYLGSFVVPFFYFFEKYYLNFDQYCIESTHDLSLYGNFNSITFKINKIITSVNYLQVDTTETIRDIFIH